MSITCRIGSVVRCGRVVTVEQAIEPSVLVDAIRDETDASRVTVDSEPPQPVHDHVGYLHPEMGLRTRTALARAARTRDLSTPYDDELAEARESLAEINIERSDITARRQAAATTEAETVELRERVAAARGRLEVRRDHDLETESAAAELEAAITELSEVETSANAATETLERTRRVARERRDRREEKLRLEDRVANLERQARAHLVEEVREEFTDALAAVPAATVPEDPFAADGLTAALAVGRVATLSAPVVYACDRFDSAAAASEWLATPVVEI